MHIRSIVVAALISLSSIAIAMPKLNINTATVQQIKALPGMNATKARAIVAYRKHNGKFTSVDTLKKISGFKRMGAAKLQAIQHYFMIS